MISSSQAPVIVIGMHRSGTSMVSRMLEAMGVFVGHRKEGNHEAMFFLEIDRWLLSQSGASWENPAPIHYLLEDADIRTLTADYMERYLIDSPRAISFLGLKMYLQHRSLFNLPVAWGWKCPLSTFTLPVWLDLFPSAKVIHIYRHGVDVANSLKQRAFQEMQHTPRQNLYYKLRFLHWLRPKVGGFIDAVRCATLDGGFSLWEEYVAEARRHVNAMGDRAVEIRYEDLLSEPHPTLRSLASFCGLPQEKVEATASLVKDDRAYAYRLNPELSAFAESVAGRLAAYSY